MKNKKNDNIPKIIFTTVWYINLESYSYDYTLNGSIPHKTVFAMLYICKMEGTTHAGLCPLNNRIPSTDYNLLLIIRSNLFSSIFRLTFYNGAVIST